jgi:Fe-S oxidoreductase
MGDYTSRKNYESFAKSCLKGKKAACVCACPFNLDVPALMGLLQEGNFSKAYRLYQSQAVFPRIVSTLCDERCRNACVRNGFDASVSLLALEKACVDFAEVKDPLQFNLPAKSKKIAVIGAGLCGLTCAQKLGAKSYDVTVYEKTGQIGGRLWQAMDPEFFLPEIELQMKNARVTYELNTEITALNDVKFDAAFIATGKGGNDFFLREGMDALSLGTVKPGVFIGGGLLDTTPVEDIAQGIVAAHSIEKFIKVSLMDGIPETFMCKESPLVINLDRVKKEPAVVPKARGIYNKDEAVKEAQRCIKCNCTACSDCCELFQYFDETPKAMVEDAVASLHTKRSIKEQRATRTVASCNLCGLCGEVCPKDIDMGKFFHDFRYFKAEDNMFPPAFHNYFIRDMHFSNEEAYFAQLAPGYEKAAHVFFPGCQIGASDPDYVEKTYEYLLAKMPDTAIIQGCCGAPADWAADRELNEAVVDQLRGEWERMGNPAFIFACPTCERQFEKFLPQIKGVSLYNILAEEGLPQDKGKIYGKACVFDACSSRHDPSMQENVRDIAIKAGVALTELYYSRDKAQCCGWGGHIQAANPALFHTMVDNRICGEDLPYITYCTNCRDTFAVKGKDCVHILDIVHGLNKENYVPPSLSQRRRNRLIAKKNLLKKVWNMDMEETEDYKMGLVLEIPEALVLKMNDQLILEEDVYHTIKSCETSGYKLYDPEKDTYIGHLRIGIITYWVEYKKNNANFMLENVYTHRVEILESLKGN